MAWSALVPGAWLSRLVNPHYYTPYALYMPIALPLLEGMIWFGDIPPV